VLGAVRGAHVGANPTGETPVVPGLVRTPRVGAGACARYDKTPAYIAAPEEARAAKRGLWANPNPLIPARYRHGGKATTISVPSSQTAAAPVAFQPSGGTLPCVEYRNAEKGATD